MSQIACRSQSLGTCAVCSVMVAGCLSLQVIKATTTTMTPRQPRITKIQLFGLLGALLLTFLILLVAPCSCVLLSVEAPSIRHSQTSFVHLQEARSKAASAELAKDDLVLGCDRSATSCRLHGRAACRPLLERIP